MHRGAESAADRPIRTLLLTSARRSAPYAVGPRKDYAALAEALDARVLDLSAVDASVATRLAARAVGPAVVQALLAFFWRDRFDAILTDGEHMGIPLALLLKLWRSRVVHVTIGHRLTAPKKRLFFRLLRVQSHLDRIVLHAQRQHDLAMRDLRIPPRRLALVPYQADTHFWRPLAVPEERLVCSAGLEWRDYPTLFRAVEGLDVEVVVGAASYWSRRSSSADRASIPANVRVDRFDYAALRDLYARAALVVVPVEEVDFQAGVTTILEAMAMGKAVIATRTSGQTDVVVDPREPLAPTFLRPLASAAGVDLEPNGLYVPPGDHQVLRQTIVYLLDNPEERARLGAAGRRLVERLMTVDQFAQRLADLVRRAVEERAAGEDGQKAPSHASAIRSTAG